MDACFIIERSLVTVAVIMKWLFQKKPNINSLNKTANLKDGFGMVSFEKKGRASRKAARHEVDSLKTTDIYGNC
jgi:hypothetical protein